MSIISLSSIFSVPNIEKTAEYYKEYLGFSAVEYLNCEEKHICLYRDEIEIILLQAKSEKIVPNRKLYGYGRMIHYKLAVQMKSFVLFFYIYLILVQQF